MRGAPSRWRQRPARRRRSRRAAADSDQSPRSARSPATPARTPQLAVPDFIALSPDAETQAAAKTIGEVLWDDIDFEREFYMIPRDTYQSIPAPTSIDDVPFDRWRELGADGVVIGTVQQDGGRDRVEMRLYNVAPAAEFGREYTGAAANPRVYAHTIADEIHKQQRSLRGVARTKLAFSSDRNRERMKAPSRSARSRRSTSPTTTAPTSAASR